MMMEQLRSKGITLGELLKVVPNDNLRIFCTDKRNISFVLFIGLKEELESCDRMNSKMNSEVVEVYSRMTDTYVSALNITVKE